MEKKIQSRKFMTFLIWVVFTVLAFFFAKEVLIEIIQYTGLISLIYIGAQGMIDFKKSVKNENNQGN